MELSELKGWSVYLLLCSNGALYAGSTNNMEARYKAHCTGKGAKFTRANPPVRVAAWRSYPDRSSALKAEYQVKQLPRAKKCAYLQATQ